MSRKTRRSLLDHLLGTAYPGEIYAYRTLRPSGRRPRQWGYVGRTRDGRRRHRQHMGIAHPGDPFPAHGQPWSDLDPVRYVLWRSKRVRNWRLALMEILFIRLLMPVYNVQHNRPNPRRIPPHVARAQRAARDAARRVPPAPNLALLGVAVAVGGVILVALGAMGALLAR